MNVMTIRVICNGIRDARIFKAITYLIISKINQSFHGEP
jgi:bacterioferritin-associated ferredoxin